MLMLRSFAFPNLKFMFLNLDCKTDLDSPLKFFYQDDRSVLFFHIEFLCRKTDVFTIMLKLVFLFFIEMNFQDHQTIFDFFLSNFIFYLRKNISPIETVFSIEVYYHPFFY